MAENLGVDCQGRGRFRGIRSTSVRVLLSESEQFRSCVWAKPFYEQVVYGGPSGLQSLRNTSFQTWIIDLATNMKVPDDLLSIMTECLS